MSVPKPLKTSLKPLKTSLKPLGVPKIHGLLSLKYTAVIHQVSLKQHDRDSVSLKYTVFVVCLSLKYTPDFGMKMPPRGWHLRRRGNHERTVIGNG